MWQWAVVMAIAAGSTGLASAHSADPRPHVPLRPDSYAQQQWAHSIAPTRVWSSSVRAGKSYGAWIDMLRKAGAIPGYPQAYTRLEFASMRESSLQTLARIIGADLFGQWWSESKHTLFLPPVRCDDGQMRQSRIVCFGWTDPGRALSTEYGQIVLEQAEQMERHHVAYAHTRLNFTDPWQEQRAAALGINPRQLGLICNADDPEHWINLDYRIEEGGMRVELDRETGEPEYEVILSQPKDWEKHTTIDYRTRQQQALGGTIWGDRLIHGRWVRAEGLVYGKVYVPAKHLVQRPDDWAKWTVPAHASSVAGEPALEAGKAMPPPSWPRFRSFDFGVNHPTVIGWYAERPDGVVMRYREVYGRGRAPSDWAELALRLEAEERRAACYAMDDEDEARAFAPFLGDFDCLESWSDHELGWRSELAKSGVWTQPALKDITAMILAVSQAFNGERLLLVQDALVEEDPTLAREKLPVTLAQELGRYKWPKRKDSASETSDKRLDAPVDRDNHACDELGYFCRGHFHAVEVWAA